MPLCWPEIEQLVLLGDKVRYRQPPLSTLYSSLSSSVLSAEDTHTRLLLEEAELLRRVELTPILEADRPGLLAAFRSRTCREVLTADWSALVSEALKRHLTAVSDACDVKKGLDVVFVAVALVQAFVVDNFTGPVVEEEAERETRGAVTVKTVMGKNSEWNAQQRKELHKRSLSLLSVDGEDVWEGCYQPHLLVLARLILVEHRELLPETWSANWWCVRVLAVHQHLLETNTATIQREFSLLLPSFHSRATSLLTEMPSQMHNDLATSAFCEALHLHLEYWQYTEAQNSLTAAEQASGIVIHIAGALGKRTRFQKFENSQLITRVELHEEKRKPDSEQLENVAECSEEDEQIARLMPVRSHMENEVLLPQLSFTSNDIVHLPLTSMQRAVLLNKIKLLKASASSHLTLDEQIIAYTNAILEPIHERSWAIEADALLMRASIEVADHHLQDRALEQMESIALHAFRMPVPLSGQKPWLFSRVAQVRLNEVYCSGWAPLWCAKLAVGKAFEKIGLMRSALDIYNSMNYLDGIIEMSIALDRKNEAEQIIRDRLVREPTPRLLCLLGTVTQEQSMFEQAWEMSSFRYPKSQRLLANCARQEKRWADARHHSKLALSLNPMFPLEWFSVGVCSLELKEYDEAILGFTQCVHFDPEYGDGWNNLAASHMHNHNHRSAMQALEQAIRLRFDSWKQWENYLQSAIALSEWNKAMTAVDHILKLKTSAQGTDKDVALHSAVVDERVLKQLTHEACTCNESEPWVLQRWKSVLESMTATRTTDSLLWDCLAQVCHANKDLNQEIEMREKAFRSSLLPIPASHPSVLARFSAFQLSDENLRNQSRSGNTISFLNHPSMRELACQLLVELVKCYQMRHHFDDLRAAQLIITSFVEQLNKSLREEDKAKLSLHLDTIVSLQSSILNELNQAQNNSASATSDQPSKKTSSLSSYASMWR